MFVPPFLPAKGTIAGFMLAGPLPLSPSLLLPPAPIDRVLIGKCPSPPLPVSVFVHG